MSTSQRCSPGPDIHRRCVAWVCKNPSHAVSCSSARVIFHLCNKNPQFFIDGFQWAPHSSCVIHQPVLCWPCRAWPGPCLAPVAVRWHQEDRCYFIPPSRASHQRQSTALLWAGLGATASSCSKSVQRQKSPAVAVCSNKCLEAKAMQYEKHILRGHGFKGDGM